MSRIIVASLQDPASVSMASYLIEHYSFRKINDENNIYRHDNFILIFTEKKHLFFQEIQEEYRKFTNHLEDIVFLSKHSSSKGIKSLTVHVTGNFGVAEMGGLDRQLSLSDPQYMSSSLRILSSHPVDDFSITFEATHHGPLLNIPSYFIEIGTTEKEWNNEDCLDSISRAVIESIPNGSQQAFVGIGGGHYPYKISNYAIQNDSNVGHIIPKYVHDNLTIDMLLQSVEKTPGFSGFIMDRKGTRGRVKEMVRSISEKLSCEIISL